ncbi:MAG: hypothetical protein COZ34_05010 [Candidatus Pacebacteria bacterium CG_4_10_14_3_um_filter_34_15]|nr:hypothetical protein [Candidatus Pacearchaeota archaeon]NCQ65876.1 hypothetical protein [Candidatus Paceibacterota bacterium]OIO44802.1 MAG: hypothetical protein AUJ41_01705 [Candidatus Pacebacteria bacterium CG1_02_43_31]PIQ81433.1 MAG: hypothetical protein COV78_00300 [Candidatus Pacebacteria bacterium CG11_big_fil_rev_8_21_14_0_20_34_55]PIX81145.1 MAG: hypothetical protein COZ34_05010 [Candidatus Pacebacteria bacterium CG_4_10_14_3_um_filter_34_15]PJC43543.1 MAG: hypothetical protein CO0
MGKKSGSFLSLLTGIALGAAAIFFSKAENRDKTKKLAKETVEKAKVEVNKAATKAKVVTKKVTSKGKKIKSKIKSDVKEIKKIAAAKK